MWTSKTGQFGEQEMAHLENMTAEELVAPLLRSDPVVALRAMAEILLNGDEQKLESLLKNDGLTAHWQSFQDDFGLGFSDFMFAEKLTEKQAEIKGK